MNLISTYLIYHTLTLQVWDVIEIQVVFMQRGIHFHISSAVTVSQSAIVTGWQIVRGPQPDSCLRERGSGGATRSIRFLSPQQSIIIAYISGQLCRTARKDYFDNDIENIDLYISKISRVDRTNLPGRAHKQSTMKI